MDQSDDDTWKTTDMGWGVWPEGMRKMLNYIQKEYNPRGVSQGGKEGGGELLGGAMRMSEVMLWGMPSPKAVQ